MFNIARAAPLSAGVAENDLPRTHNGLIAAFSLEEERRRARENWLRLRQQKIEGTRAIGHEELSPSPDNDVDE